MKYLRRLHRSTAVFIALAFFVTGFIACGGGGGGGGSSSTETKSSEKKILSFSVSIDGSEYSGVVDEDAKTVAVGVPYGTEVTALAPTINVSSGATVSPASGVAQNFTSPVTYTVTAADDTTQEYVVTVTVSTADAKKLTGFSFTSPAVTGVVNEDTKTVTIGVPDGTDRTALVATFSFEGSTVKVGDTVQVSGTTANDFTNPVTYTIVAGDSSTQDYVVTVKSSTKKLTGFSFTSPVATGLVNEGEKTVTVQVPSDSGLTSLIPTIEVSPEASVIPASGVAQNFTNPVTYTVTAEDGTTQEYVVTVKLTGTACITMFYFIDSDNDALEDSAHGTIFEDEKKIYVPVPVGTDVTALKPSISLSSRATVSPASKVVQNFTNPVTYTVTAEDGTVTLYEVVVKVAQVGTDCEYVAKGDEVIFTKYTGSDTEIVIPAQIGDVPVTTVGRIIIDKEFSVTKVTISDGIEYISDYAFGGCKMATIDIPDSVTKIGNSAFVNCSNLESVIIPKNVNFIGTNIFSGCTKLESITVDADNEKYCDEEGVLFTKDLTELIAYPLGNIRTTYSIPEGVTTIPEKAFANSYYITSVTIPKSVGYIGDGVFGYCTKLESITVHADNEKYCDVEGVLFTKDKKLLIKYPINKAGTSYTIPDGVITVERMAFGGSKNVDSVTIPASVTFLGSSVFYSCDSFEFVVYVNRSVVIDGSISVIDVHPFFGSNNFTIYVPADSVDAYKAADNWSEYADKIVAQEP